MVLIFAILVSGCAKEIEEVIPQSPEIKTDITDARAHFDEGIEYYDQGNLEEAISKFEQATKLDPENLEYKYRLARAYSEGSMPDKAIEVWKSIHREETEYQAKPYKYVTEKPTGWFETDQEADLILYATGFNDSGGSLVLNHPGKVASDGKRLIVSDTWNNRVLIWNQIPIQDNQPPDLVIGQPDFNSNVARLGADGMNWPMGIATDGNKLIIGDAFNDRVLIWNTFPIKNGQPADMVLGAHNFDTWPNYLDREQERNSKTRIYWPWDIWTDGEKLVVGSTGGGGALVWKKFPTKNNQPADFVIGSEDFSTRFADPFEFKSDPMVRIGGPRGMASDGEKLVIGAYQPQQAYVWNEFPETSGVPADFILAPKGQEDEPPMGVMGVDIEDGKLYAASSHHIFVWDSFPIRDKQEPDKKLGKQMVREESLILPDSYLFHKDTFNSPYDVEIIGNKMVVADTNNNRVLIFNEIPSDSNVKADVVIGNPEIFISRNSFGSGTAPFSDGKRLILGTDGFGVWIYNKLPDESKANADVVVGKLIGGTIVGGPAITVEDKLIMVERGGSSIFVWNEIPTKDNQLPDVVLGKWVVFDEGGRPGAGKIAMNQPTSIASDGEKLFVADWMNNRVLVWNTIPTKSQTPADLVLGQPDFESTTPGNTLERFENPTRVATDGKRLAVAEGNGRVLIWKSIPFKNGQPADFEIKVVDHKTKDAWENSPQSTRLALPAGVDIYDGKLFIADTGNYRILVWNEFPESEADEPDRIIGQKDIVSNYPSNARDGLFMPAYVNFDGSFLWVGEVKWSNRVLRYSIGK